MEDYDVWYLRGKVCLSMNEMQEAIASLRRAIELRPADSSAYYQLALACRNPDSRPSPRASLRSWNI